MFNHHAASTAQASAEESFETIAGNHPAYPATLSYAANGALDSKVLETESGPVTIAYSYNASGSLIAKTLSGALPAGVPATKYYTYDLSGQLTGTSYAS